MVVIFIIALVSGKTAAITMAALLSCLVPDEIPFVDEVIEIALLMRVIYAKSKGGSPNGVVNSAGTNASTGNLSAFREK